MLKRLVLITALPIALGLAACGKDGGSPETKGNMQGAWEGTWVDTREQAGKMEMKGRVTFNGNSYTYQWLRKLTDKEGKVAFDWTETGREEGKVSFTDGFMQWTATSFGEAMYNEAAKTWGTINMKSSSNGVNVYYTLSGNKLTLKEDVNLDGDFDDFFGVPETIEYTKAG
jgi:hypothetical protein